MRLKFGMVGFNVEPPTPCSVLPLLLLPYIVSTVRFSSSFAEGMLYKFDWTSYPCQSYACSTIHLSGLGNPQNASSLNHCSRMPGCLIPDAAGQASLVPCTCFRILKSTICPSHRVTQAVPQPPEPCGRLSAQESPGWVWCDCLETSPSRWPCVSHRSAPRIFRYG